MMFFNKLSMRTLTTSVIITTLCLLALFVSKIYYTQYTQQQASLRLEQIQQEVTHTVQKNKLLFSSLFAHVDATTPTGALPNASKDFSSLMFIQHKECTTPLLALLFPGRTEIATLIESTIASEELSTSYVLYGARSARNFVWLCVPCYKNTELVGIGLGKMPLTLLLSPLTSTTATTYFIAQNREGTIAPIKSALRKPSAQEHVLLKAACYGKSQTNLSMSRSESRLFFTTYEPELSLGIVGFQTTQKAALIFFILQLILMHIFIVTLALLLYHSYKKFMTRKAPISPRAKKTSVLNSQHKRFILYCFGIIVISFYTLQVFRLNDFITQIAETIHNDHIIKNEVLS